MKKLLIIILALVAFGTIKAFVAKMQIEDAGMKVAIQESGKITGPKG